MAETLQTVSSESKPPGPPPAFGATWFEDLIPGLADRSEAFRTFSESVDGKLLLAFAEQMRLAIQGLQDAVQTGDLNGIRAHAHSLLGMGGTAGAPEISVVGEELSRSAKQGDLKRCGDLTARLDRWQMDWISASTPGGSVCLRDVPQLSGRILVVDDERPNRLFLRKLLTDCGATVIEAESGEQALVLAQQHAPDLALVDVMMPGLSGYDVCRRLVENPVTHHMATIMVTARSAVEDIEHAFILGAFDYIRKPFHARELLARVRNALQLKNQNDELRHWQARMIREMDAAGALQRKLLATDPFFGEAADVRFAHQSSMSVGGDVFNAFSLPDHRLCLYVGDVAGHGVGPAMVSTLLKALVDEVAREQSSNGPAAMCALVHERFRHYVTNPEMFATLFLALLDPRGDCVAFNCGHPMPLLFDARGHPLPTFEDRGGLPIGLSIRGESVTYAAEDEVRLRLPPGGRLALYSDGLIEARHAVSLEPCGTQMLSRVLSEGLRDPRTVDPSRVALERLLGMGYQLAADDCTLVVAAQRDPAEICLDRRIAVSHEAVADLAAEVCRALQAQGWPEEAAGAAQLLTMEHGANVVDHAATPPDSRIALQVRLSNDSARLLFRDAGRDWPFRERLEVSMRQDVDSCRGRGLRMIRALASHIDVMRRDGHNEFFYIVRRDFDAMLSNPAPREPLHE